MHVSMVWVRFFEPVVFASASVLAEALAPGFLVFGRTGL